MNDISLFDLSALLVKDNPFKGQRAAEFKAQFKQYRTRNPSEFLFLDLEHSMHSHHVLSSPIASKINDETSFEDFDPDVVNIVKTFFTKNKDLNFDEETINWASRLALTEDHLEKPAESPVQISRISEPISQVPAYQPEQTDILNIAFPTTSDEELNLARTTYDFVSNNAISWGEVAEICFNIAKAKHVNNNLKNADMERIEKDRKAQLIETIHKYLAISALSTLSRDDLSKMSLQSLEELKARCVSKFETCKTSEAAVSILNIASMIVNSIAPNGIKLRKRRIKMNSIKDTLIQTLFSSNTVTGAAFLMSLDERNVRVSNGWLIASKVIEIMLDKLEVVDAEDEKGPVVEELDSNENDDSPNYADMQLRD